MIHEFDSISSFKAQKMSPNYVPPEEGDVAIIADEKIAYTYRNGSWEQEKSEGLKVNLYDLNRQMMSKAPALPALTLSKKACMINQFVFESNNKHYMLLNNDMKYYTVFQKEYDASEFKFIGDAVITCLREVGKIKSISLTEDKAAIEIWVDDQCFMFFPYDQGIVYWG